MQLSTLAFEHGLVVDYAIGWDMEDEEQKEVERRVMEEELVYAGRLFLHENPWISWSWDLSFVKEMRDKDDVHEAKGNACRFQMTDRFSENDVEKSWFMSNSECIIEELREWCNQDSYKTRAHRIRFVLALLRGLKNERDSAMVIGSREVCVTCGEPIVLVLDEYSEELFDIFDSISGIRLDPELLKVSKQVELDFMSRLGVYRKRPRQWATDRGIVIPTKCLDVNKRGRQAARMSIEIVREGAQTLGSYNAGNFCINGTV